MKVRLYTYWLNSEPPSIWSRGFREMVLDLPDGVRIVGCQPSSMGYELVLMEEVTEE